MTHPFRAAITAPGDKAEGDLAAAIERHAVYVAADLEDVRQLELTRTLAILAQLDTGLALFAHDPGDLAPDDGVAGVHDANGRVFARAVRAPISPAAVTATADGLTTGVIPTGAAFVSIASASADDIVTLPPATVGAVIRGHVGANGCELQTPADSDATINGVDCDGANEAAIPADTTIRLECVAADAWLLLAWDDAGEALPAIVPDAV